MKGDFFVLASLAVQALIFSALHNWTSTDAPLGTWKNLTNGPFGITGIPRPELFGWKIATPQAFALFATVVAAICAFILWRLTASPWGRLLLAMREDELAARGLGKNTRLAKVQAFAISAALVAVAGPFAGLAVGSVINTGVGLAAGVTAGAAVGGFAGAAVGAVLSFFGFFYVFFCAIVCHIFLYHIFKYTGGYQHIVVVLQLGQLFYLWVVAVNLGSKIIFDAVDDLLQTTLYLTAFFIFVFVNKTSVCLHIIFYTF